MVLTINKNTAALGDNEHKGEDVSLCSPIGLATVRLLQRPPGSLPRGWGLDQMPCVCGTQHPLDEGAELPQSQAQIPIVH